ncbi:MAG: CheY-like chemotaxis protein [Oleispira sp.]|jgi:CheY-like chemotaxis protein
MKKILLVEGNEMNSDMLSRRLIRKGFDVVLAKNGAQAVEMAFSEYPQLILMDLNLPDINGWEATRQIREREIERHIPIIAVTAHAMSFDYEKAIAAGFDHYELKPIQLTTLLKKMHILLERVDDN